MEEIVPQTGRTGIGSAPLISRADILGRDAGHIVTWPEARERGEDAAGPALAGETVAYTDAPRLAFEHDGQLTARTGRSSRHDGLLDAAVCWITGRDSYLMRTSMR